jgi:hypothetical protein
MRLFPPLFLESRIVPPPTAIIKFLENVEDHTTGSAPFTERAIILDVSFPNNPCARPVPARHCAPTPVPTPRFEFIPVVTSDVGILANVSAFVHNDGDTSKLFINVSLIVVFHPFAPVGDDVQAIRELPAPQLAIHTLPVHVSPFNFT